MNLFTWNEYKAFTGLTKDQSAYPEFDIIQKAVFARLEGFLKIKFVSSSAEQTEIVYSDSKMIPLQALPIVSITSVQADEEGELSAIEKFRIRNYGLELTESIEESELSKKYTIKYFGGYALVGGNLQVPEAIKRAAIYQTKYEMDNRASLGAESISTDQGTINRPAFYLLKEIQATLAPYRHSYFTCPVI